MQAEPEVWIVQALSDPRCYDHPTAGVELIETHISWIFLAGRFAYKVKKPLNFGFLDFSTLAKRRHYCHEEVRLNRRFAPQLYLGVTQLGGDPESPGLGGEPALEYAVKMRRFPQDSQLDRMLAANRLQARHLSGFAMQIARWHQQAPVADREQDFGSPASVLAPLQENFRQLIPVRKQPVTGAQLLRLEQWTITSFEKLEPFIARRKTDGFVRECHGDTHLANMAWLEEQPLLFDCIEFNENLRWIDIISDIAFLVMDLDDRGESALGWHFLNHYLQHTGDYPGLHLLVFYQVYRALVRAKVTWLRLAQGHLEPMERQRTLHLFGSYLDLAERYSSSCPTPLLITHGFSGAGKSTFAAQLATLYGAIHLRSDVERKRLHGLAPCAASGSPLDAGIYSAGAFATTYARLQELAGTVLTAGFPVIIDATCLKQQQREMFHRLAAELGVPLVILDFQVAEETLRQRVVQRAQRAERDPSEATEEVLDFQLEHAEPLTRDEERLAIRVHVDTRAETVANQLQDLLSERVD